MRINKVYHLCLFRNIPSKYHPQNEHKNQTLHNEVEIANEITKILRTNELSVVFLEGMVETSRNYQGPMTRAASTLFPHGIPLHFASLSKIQGDFLYEVGAVKTLHYLGAIRTLFRTMRPEKLEKMNQSIANGEQLDLLKAQQEEALTCFEESQSNETISHGGIFVFSNLYDFNSYCKNKGYHYEQKACGFPSHKITYNESKTTHHFHAINFFASQNKSHFPRQINEKSYHVIGNVYFTFTQHESNLQLSIVFQGETIKNLTLTPRETLKILTNLSNFDRLITVLKTMGDSTSKIADLMLNLERNPLQKP